MSDRLICNLIVFRVTSGNEVDTNNHSSSNLVTIKKDRDRSIVSKIYSY